MAGLLSLRSASTSACRSYHANLVIGILVTKMFTNRRQEILANLVHCSFNRPLTVMGNDSINVQCSAAQERVLKMAQNRRYGFAARFSDFLRIESVLEHTSRFIDGTQALWRLAPLPSLDLWNILRDGAGFLLELDNFLEEGMAVGLGAVMAYSWHRGHLLYSRRKTR
jgi:hypothetical protein